jgi:hypothetical protein
VTKNSVAVESRPLETPADEAAIAGPWRDALQESLLPRIGRRFA